jgi:hypothetical protein
MERAGMSDPPSRNASSYAQGFGVTSRRGRHGRLRCEVAMRTLGSDRIQTEEG